MRSVSLVVIASLFATAAVAQTAQPDPVKLEVSRATLGLIASGVMKLPYEQAQPILIDLSKQVEAQAPKAASEPGKIVPSDKPSDGAK